MELTSAWIPKYVDNCKNRNYMSVLEYVIPHELSLEDTVRKIMGRNYDLLYSYFYNVLSDDFDYKILRARRCQVLFSIFLQIMLEKEENMEIKGIFLSSHAVPKYKREICESRAVILDDIVIHGRGLQELYEELDPEYSNPNIQVYVHKMDKSANAMSKKFKDKVKCDAKVFDWEWREVSTQMVKVIHASVEPYVSYSPAYSSWDRIDLENINLEVAFDVKNITSRDQKDLGTVAYVLFEKADVPTVIQSYGYDACVRYYINNEMGRAVYVPFVFMKDIADREIKRFCDQMAASIKSDFPALAEELRREQNNDLDLRYKTYLMNVLLNHLYRLHIDEKYSDLLPISKCDLFTLAMCFGNDVADEIAKLTYCDIDESIWTLRLADLRRDDSLLSNEGETEIENIKLIEGLRAAIRETEEKKALMLYFFYDRQMDEENAKKKRRGKGLSLKTFYNELSGNIHDASASQLACWDVGAAACDMYVCFDNGARQVCSYIRAGEQSFRYIMEMLPKKNNRIDREALEAFEAFAPMEKLKDKVIQSFYRANKERLCAWK